MVFHNIMIHIEVLFTKVPVLLTSIHLFQKSSTFKNYQQWGSHGTNGTHASVPSLSNYKTVKTTLSLQIVSILTLPDWIIFDYFYCYLSLLLALNNKKLDFLKMYTTKTLKENLDASSKAVAPALKFFSSFLENGEFILENYFKIHSREFSRNQFSRNITTSIQMSRNNKRNTDKLYHGFYFIKKW